MADFDCPQPCIICPPGLDGDNPSLNLSSEAPDTDRFLGRSYPYNPNPIGDDFYQQGCVGTCYSSVSQSEADLCAARQAVVCGGNPGGGGGDNPDGGGSNVRRKYPNTAQTCTAECPDGTTSSYTVPAGTILAYNQATANAQAYSLACIRAQQDLVCLSDLSRSRICVAVDSVITLSATGSFLTTEFILVSGELPPGMELNFDGVASASITGTPTTAGDYTFTIGCVDAGGGFGERTYTLAVLGITNVSFPDATENTPYNQAITISGTPVGTPVYSVVAGSLPTGLSIVGATIQGTPTVPAGFEFTLGVTDDVGTCRSSYDITVNPGSSCPDFTAVVWGAPTIDTFNGGSASNPSAGNTLEMHTNSGPFIFPFGSYGYTDIAGTVSYTGPGGTCCCQITLAGTGNAVDNTYLMLVKQDGVTVLTVPGVASGNYSFVLINSPVASVIEISANCLSSTDNSSQAQKNIDLTVVFGECP
jgi:hypothetical protein